jgi:hypothetical protein
LFFIPQPQLAPLMSPVCGTEEVSLHYRGPSHF